MQGFNIVGILDGHEQVIEHGASRRRGRAQRRLEALRDLYSPATLELRPA